jgi:hypothetical protein
MQQRAGGKFVGNTPTLAILQAANDALVSIRKSHPELQNVVLVIASGQKRSGAVHGHFAPDTWESKTASHEILLSSESLSRGAEATLGTLLHECAHLLARVRGIKDTSRQGRFHNAKFKALAEELGIEVHQDPTIGWSVTTLPTATAKVYKLELSALRKALKAYRRGKVEPKAPKKTIRLECGCRGLTVPLSFIDKGGITCDACGMDFQ